MVNQTNTSLEPLQKQRREKLRNLNKRLSYTRTRERLLEALVDIVLRNKDFVLIVFVEVGGH